MCVVAMAALDACVSLLTINVLFPLSPQLPLTQIIW